VRDGVRVDSGGQKLVLTLTWCGSKRFAGVSNVATRSLAGSRTSQEHAWLCSVGWEHRRSFRTITICSGVSEGKIVDETDATGCGENREIYCLEMETLSPPR